MANVLIIDDDAKIGQVLAELSTGMEHLTFRIPAI
jgi:hypothetical protein